MKQLYVIGDPVDYSLSPMIHTAALKKLDLEHEYQYDKLRLKKTDLQQFVDRIRRDEIHGASVTLPYKEIIIEYVDQLTKEAELIQAANTLYHENGLAVAHNTDGIGCIRSFKEAGITLNNKQVILLGAGGAAKAIAFSLIRNNITKLHIFNRNQERAANLVRIIKKHLNCNVRTDTMDNLSYYMKDADILINATSVGMKGISEGTSLVNPSLLHSRLVVQDIVYNPRKTALISEAEKIGATTVDGIDMLIHQGAEQFKIFTGKNAPVAVMKYALLEVLS